MTQNTVAVVVDQILTACKEGPKEGVSGSVLFTPAIPHMTFDVFDDLMDSLVQVGLLKIRKVKFNHSFRDFFTLTVEGARRLEGGL